MSFRDRTFLTKKHMGRTNKTGTRANVEGRNRGGSREDGGVSRGRTPDAMERRETSNQSRRGRPMGTTYAQNRQGSGANILSGGDTTDSTEREKDLERQLKKFQEKFKKEKEERKKLERWQKLKTEHGRKVTGETDAEEYERVVDYVKNELFRQVKFITDEKEMLGDWRKKGSVGAKVIKGMNIEDEEADRWWGLYKPAISRGIADRRNIASVAVKAALKGMMKKWGYVNLAMNISHWQCHYLTEAKRRQDDPNTSYLVPGLSEILELRRDPEEDEPEKNDAYKFFVDKILGCAIGKRAWGKDKKCFKTVTAKGVTVSDEAFALLIMENQWNVIFRVGGETRYTGKAAAGTANRRNSGWSKQGIERFNQLVLKVKENRSEAFGLEAEDQIRRELKKEYYPVEQYGILQSPSQAKKGKRKRISEEEEEALPVAFVDLMSDEEDEDSDAGSDEE